ncbi:MAG: sigma 54-interacting transcriptional regulator [Desulfovibrionaceae bacterium]|jgi:PAS domain S-box-containing protein|nr:sigma 54-interacting transcriptional regulator [Desulfovibrionaceae bacterium]
MVDDNNPQGYESLLRHFNDILDILQDGVYISDTEGRTLYVNAAYEKLVGVDAAELVGKSVHELVANGFFTTIVNPQVVASGSTTTSVQEVRGRTVVLHGYPVLDDRGKVELVVTFVRDITAFARLKREIATQRTLIDSYQRQVANFNPESVFQDDGMVAVSEASLNLLASLENIAPTDAAVLILGETGVGKDIVARKIHKKSQRASLPFLKVDCTAIPESLVESELFGYAPGAFSGAHTKGKEGFFEKANNGTLFLDEIGELSLVMQTKLLRAIQDQEIIRLGSTKVTPVNVRIVAATNRNLEQEVLDGTFRSDLFYRLKVAVLQILPLRERRDDILPLARVFLYRFNNKYNKNIMMSNDAENAIFHYDWPGNVREMENTIHSIVVMCTKDLITSSDLPQAIAKNGEYHDIAHVMQAFNIGKRSLKEMVRDMELEIINETLAIYGTASKAAEVLQVDRGTLFRKLKAAHKAK